MGGLDPIKGRKDKRITILCTAFTCLKNAWFSLGDLPWQPWCCLPVWIYLAPYYLAGITALVNLGLHSAGTVSQFRLQPLTGTEVLLPGVVGGAALFIATPGRSMAWKVGWVALVVALSGLALTITLFVQTHNTYPQLLDKFASAQRLVLEQNLSMPWLLNDGIKPVLGLVQPGFYFLLDISLWFLATQR